MTSIITLNASDSATVNTAKLQTAVDAVGSGGTVEIPTGAFEVLGLKIPAGVSLVGAARLMAPVMAVGDGTPIAYAMGANVTIDDHLTFDGRRELQSYDGFSDSVDGGGHPPSQDPRGRAYRCAIRADINSGLDGQAPCDGLTVNGATFLRLYGAGVISRGGDDIVINGCTAYQTNFELAHISICDGAVVTNNTLTEVGSGHATTNPDGFVVGANNLTFTGNVGRDIERCLIKTSCTNSTIAYNTMVGNNLRWFGSPGVVGSYAGIHLEICDTVAVYDNVLRDVGSGIAISNSDAVDIDIDNNTIDGTNGDTTPDGIIMQPGGIRVNVRGNSVTNVLRHGVYASGAMADLQILGNHLRGAGGGVGVWLVSANEVFTGPVVRGNSIADFYGIGGAGVLGLYKAGTGTFADVEINANLIDATGAFDGRGIFWHQDTNYLTGTVQHNTVVGGRISIAPNVGLTTSPNYEAT